MPDFTYLGKRIAPIEGAGRVTGRTKFATDMQLPNMLYGKALRSPLPHAKILSINTSKAKKLPGVYAVLTYDDTPGIPFGPMVDDWYILAKEKVTFVGQEVAAVAAIDLDTAAEALSLIDVEYEQLPAIFDKKKAMEPDAPQINEMFKNNIVNHFHVERGNVEEAFANSDYIYSGSFETTQVYQAYLEPMACFIEPDLNGNLTMWLPTQIPSKCRLTYAKGLGISPDNLRVIKPDIGGAFGAKLEHNLHVVCALLALKTRRPVKMFHTREEDFIAGNPRVPMHIELKLGFKNDGKITAKEVRIIAGNGGRTVYSIPIMSTACYRVDSLYTFENLKTDGYSVYTNTVPTGCFRGFGNAQMTFALESALDEAACHLGIDPIDLRLINAPQDGYVSAHGWKLNTVGLSECLKQVRSISDWDNKYRDKKPYRGLGLACCNHVSGNRAFFPPMDGGAAFIRVAENGKITVFNGEADMGQGQITCFAIIAAEQLGARLEDINMADIDTQISPFGLGSWATRATVMGGNGVKAAAADTRAKLLETAGEMLQVPKESLDIKDSIIFQKGNPSISTTIAEVARNYAFSRAGAHLIGQGYFKPDTVIPDAVTKYGNISPLYPFAAHIAEVEIDPETGQVTVLNYWAAHDVGRVINRLALEGQVEGGVSNGIGWVLMEDMVTVDGHIQNPNFLDYRIPGSLDVPCVNKIFVETDDPNGPFGAKGIGEPVLNPVAAAIANAVFDATGIRIKDMPLSQEKIFKALKTAEKNK